jgi:hypothetical protein
MANECLPYLPADELSEMPSGSEVEKLCEKCERLTAKDKRSVLYREIMQARHKMIRGSARSLLNKWYFYA